MLLPSNALQDTKSKEIQDYSNAPKKKKKKLRPMQYEWSRFT